MEPDDGSRRRWAFSCFRATLACMVVLEAAFAIILPEGLQTRMAHEVARAGTAVPAADLAIMGDSVAAIAIDQEILAAALGDGHPSVGNYSIAGSSPLYTHTLLHRLLAAGRRPGAIIYAPHPAMLGTPMVDRYYGRFATTREMADVFGGLVRLPDALLGIASRLSYTLRYREEIRAFLLDGDPGFFRTLYAPTKPWRPPVKGGLLPPLPPEPVAAPEFARHIGPALARPIAIDPTVDKALGRFLALAREEGIPVYWWLLPTCESLATLPGRAEGVRRLESYLADLERAGLIVRLNTRLEVWPDRYFSDPWHLGPYGAAKNSRQLVAALRGRGGGR